MALAPAQTTITSVWPSSSRSAEMSMVVSAPGGHRRFPRWQNFDACHGRSSWWWSPWWRRPPGPPAQTDPGGRPCHCLALLAQVLISSLVRPAFSRPPRTGNGGGHRSILPDDPLHLQRRLHILGIGHTVGDDGDSRATTGLPWATALGHFGVHVKILIHFFPPCSCIRCCTRPRRVGIDGFFSFHRDGRRGVGGPGAVSQVLPPGMPIPGLQQRHPLPRWRCASGQDSTGTTRPVGDRRQKRPPRPGR